MCHLKFTAGAADKSKVPGKQVPALQSVSWSAAQCLTVVLSSSMC